MTSRRFIIEADGGSRGNPGPAGYGATVRDGDTGELLAEVAEYLGHATNNVAEYRGLIAGLRAAHAIDPTARVDVRMDSKLVVEQMSGRWQVKHPSMQPLAAEAGRVFPRGQVHYTWIPRNQNKDADRLANEAMDAGQAGRQWTPKPSSPSHRAPSGATTPSAAGNSAGPERDAAAAGAASAAQSDRAPSGAVPSAAVASAAEPFPAAGTTAGPDHDAAAASAAGASAASVSAASVSAASASAAAAVSVGWGQAADMGAPTTLVLLRHGETALTPEKRFSGSRGSDPELSERGRAQAQSAAAALAARGGIEAIVSSPLLRCRQTAQAVADRLGLEVCIDEGLRETDFGAFEGLTFAEAKQRHPAELDAWLASARTAPPGGESFTAVGRRVAVSRDKLLARYAGRTVLVVSHVTPVKTLVRLALGAPPESLFRMELSAAALCAIQYYADGNASLRFFNDTSHLAGLH